MTINETIHEIVGDDPVLHLSVLSVLNNLREAGLIEPIAPSDSASPCDVPGNTGLEEMNLRELAKSYLNRADEDWTWCDPEDVKRLAQAVLDHVR